MKFKDISQLFFCLLVFSGTQISAQNAISGKVTDGQIALKGVSIRIAEKTVGTTTDDNGNYTIIASPKDILIFSYLGMTSVEIMVEDVTTKLNIELAPNVEELDEVVVLKYKRKTQKDLARTFYSDTTIIDSNAGYLSPNTVGYELRVVDGKNLNNKAYDILDAIAETLPGVTIRTIEGERYLFTDSFASLRGAASAAYEVDGIFRDSRSSSSSVPFEVDISSVLRIGIIPGGEAVRRYGPTASGGVVVINTNRNTYGERETGNRPYDQAKLRNNIYLKDAVSQEAMRTNQPIYLRELYDSEGEDEALAIYNKHKTNFGSSYSYALEVYRFFIERFGDNVTANQIFEKNKLLFDENPVAIKALAYTHQQNGKLVKANELYKEVFLLRPEYGQSYLDLANSYQEVKAYKKALSLYTRYNHLMDKGYIKKDSSRFAEIFERDFNNLVAQKGKEVITDKTFEHQGSAADFKGTRLVFEWNDSEAEFEIQFVNPLGNYVVENHSLFGNSEQIQLEKTIGYSCQEFLMDDSLPGIWQINTKYLGNRKLSASYLKATIYYDYGLKTQRKETKVFKLAPKNVNQELFKINITPSLTSN